MNKYISRKKWLFLFIFGAILSIPGFAQTNINVKGVVTDASSGETLIGVSVVQVGVGTVGTVTDVDGSFSLEVPQGASLRFSYIGYESIEIAARPEMKVELKESKVMLDEVVVIGYGTVKRKDLTTAVSTVSNKEIDERPIISTAQAIQGKAAGVSVIQPNGAPGGETSIRIRGTTSLNGSNEPLYVVDGVPVDDLKFLAPSDIENIQILKDASSAAIYGSRGANGVIIITTKSGAQKSSKITFGTQLGFNKLSNPIQSLNAAEYKSLMDEIRPGAVPDGTTDVTNWYNEVYKTGVTQNYQVSVADGNDKLRYYVSGGYLNEQGIITSSFFKRYSFRANVNNQIRKWLNIGANISYSDNLINGINTGNGSNRGGIVLGVVNLPTSVPVKNADGLYNRVFYGQNIVNPVEDLQNGKNNKNRENRLIASGNALITFAPELNLKSTFTLDRRNGLITAFTPPVHAADRDDWGTGRDERNMNTVTTFDNVLTYNKSFKKHGLEVMLGSSFTNSDYSNSWINGSNYRDGNISTLNAANKIDWTVGGPNNNGGTGTGASQWGIMSYFGRAAYNYDSKYLLTVNMRADGSSKLDPSHRWGYFPSVSAAWRISSESFLHDWTWLDDMKIRGGWGQTGNQSGLGDYAYLQSYNLQRQAWFITGQDNFSPNITPANLTAVDLTWETTTQSGVGLDITLFKSRLTVIMDYYYKLTTKMLINVDLGPTAAAGLASQYIKHNEGEMTNKGFEFSVSSRNIQGRRFNWNTDFNISFNKNRLISLETQQIYYDASTSDVLHGMPAVRNEPGRSLGGFYGYISDGVDPETGQLMYRDLNGDGRISSSDRTYIGDPNPKFIYGMTNTFSWKDLNLSIFLQGTYGNDIFNASKMETQGMYDLKNQSVDVLNRWERPGQIAKVPKANFTILPSTYFIEDGSYLRVKDVTLSYNIKANLLRKWGISRLQPYFTANNLFTLTKYRGMDPEVNQWGDSGTVQGIDWGTYPQSKSYIVGFNVEF